MKILSQLLIMSLSCAGLVQENDVPKPPTAEQVISRLISGGLWDGHDTKVLAGRGNGAAAIVAKVTKDKKLTAAEKDYILLILNTAFAGDDSRSLAPDRQHSVAMSLLRRLDAST